MVTMIVETNWMTYLVQGLSEVVLLVGIYLTYKQYKFQRLEAVEKADKQIAQNDIMIGLLKEIVGKK